MMSKALSFLAIFWLFVGPVAEAEIGTIDNVPAATLLLPYFEVALEPGGDYTTVVRIGNASSAPTVVHATLWTNVGIPTYAFDIYLGGYDVQEVVLETLFQGILPHTGPVTSHTGPLSQPHADLGCGAVLPPRRMTETEVELIQQAHSAMPVDAWGSLCAGADLETGLAHGYITFDVARACSDSTTFPTDALYFENVAGTTNQIWGEVEVRDIANNSSTADALVHIEADPNHSLTDGIGDYTFYGQYVLGMGLDHREGLATTWAAFYLSVPGMNDATRLTVWRDPVVRSPFACGGLPDILTDSQIEVFDENEQVVIPSISCFSAFGQRVTFPFATQRIEVGGPSLPTPFAAGWLYLDLNHSDNAMLPNPLFGRLNQAWVGQRAGSLGLYAGAKTEWPLDNVATAAAPGSSTACPECSDGIANDGDGLVDFGEDPQCTSEWDDTERLTECEDGIDNDGDGDVDYPYDPGCGSAESEPEGTQCDDGVDNDTDGYIDYPDDLGCEHPVSNLEGPVCHDGIDNDGDGKVDYPNDPGCVGPTSSTEAPACSNGLDDDGDGLIDFPADPGCLAPSESNERPPCMDNVDNDGDGLIDYPAESGCAEAGDLSEEPDCSDGIDNDGDGLADFGVDPGCASADDLNERASTTVRACSDGLDNDGDGLIDFGQDPGCISAYDDNEFNR
jgi:hypothetical protein